LQIPPDLVVKSQAIDITEVILSRIRRPNTVQTLCRNRISRFEQLSTSEAHWSTTKSDGMCEKRVNVHNKRHAFGHNLCHPVECPRISSTDLDDLTCKAPLGLTGGTLRSDAIRRFVAKPGTTSSPARTRLRHPPAPDPDRWSDASDLFHRIILSAWNSTCGGIVRPSVFAVCRLMTNSNFIGCSTGMSAGFAPFKILSTYRAPSLPSVA
jgi:hypothetical protein